MKFPGLRELGRGVVVLLGQPTPEAWADCPRVIIGDEVFADAKPVADLLHKMWANRKPIVIEVGVDLDRLREPEVCHDPVYSLDPTFEFSRERVWFLIWANNYDATKRSSDPIWLHGAVVASRFGDQGVSLGGPADVLLADGTPLYIDGGPTGPPELADGAGVVHRWNYEAGSLTPARHSLTSAILAPDQLAAVSHRSGPARVIAPAGSGKTRVLTERLTHLVRDRGVHPQAITALAYNVEAAKEMEQRCEEVRNSVGPAVRTINGMSWWICKTFGGHEDFTVANEVVCRRILETVVAVPKRTNVDNSAPYLDALREIRLGLRSPDEVERSTKDAVGVADAFEKYRAALADRRLIDFDEQIYRAIEILLTNSEARVKARQQCRHLLVDEFQDLRPAHLLLIRLLSAPAYDCFGVGDDDQVIYGYSGASPTFLIDFDEHFPGATHYELTTNHRCPPAIVTAAANLLSHNRIRIPKEICSALDRTNEVLTDLGSLSQKGPLVTGLDTSDQLAEYASAVIRTWLKAGVSPDEIVVLARVNASLMPIQIACGALDIPTSMPVEIGFLRRTGVATALTYLRMTSDLDEIKTGDVGEVNKRRRTKISYPTIKTMAKVQAMSIHALTRFADSSTGNDTMAIRSLVSDLRVISNQSQVSTAEGLRAIREVAGLGSIMDGLDSSKGSTDRSTHRDDLVALESVAGLHEDAATFEQWLRGEFSHHAPAGPSVTLSSIHKFKGREKRFVLLYGANEGLMPHHLSETPEQREEERRVFHVAITRAREQLVILGDQDNPSPFLTELTQMAPLDGAGSCRQLTEDESHQEGSGSIAAVGIEISKGGQDGIIVEVREEGALVKFGGLTELIKYGSTVTMFGSCVQLARPVEELV